MAVNLFQEEKRTPFGQFLDDLDTRFRYFVATVIFLLLFPIAVANILYQKVRWG